MNQTKAEIKNDYNKNKKVKVNFKKTYILQILVVQFSSICLVSIKRAEGHGVFTKIFPTFVFLFLLIETVVEMKKSRGQSLYFITLLLTAN